MATDEQIDAAADELVDQAGVQKVRTVGGGVVEMDAGAGLDAIKAIEGRGARKSGKRRIVIGDSRDLRRNDAVDVWEIR